MTPTPEAFDIVIVGAGPVGLLLSDCLARWGYKIKHIDNRPQPTSTGRADGIQPRSLDLLKNMGLKSAIMAHKPAKVYEVAFWDPKPSGGIHRTGTWPSCPGFIDARYTFVTLLHQGHIERVFLNDMAKYNVHVDRPWTIVDFENNGKDPQYPVQVRLDHVDGGKETLVKAKYLFSGEGARSTVRQSLGIQVHHKDPISHVWGVMDGVVNTDFPDIKTKCTIHSDAGSIMVIPREANMVRLYIQLASSTDKDFNPRKTATEAEVQQHAKDILKPYSIEWETVDWYSVYPIGQGIAERYTLDERVFMGGDACHTHSPKAGQGMNTAFLDAQNLAWKIHHVEAGFADRSILKTYESERRHIADQLLNFDAKFAKLFSTKQPAQDVVNSANDSDSANTSAGNKQEGDFIKTFKESCEFTSGYGVAYQPNLFNWSPSHAAKSSLFLAYPEQTRLRTGRILIGSNVTRVVDANAVHLEQEVPTNGSWRVYIYAGTPTSASKVFSKRLADLAVGLKKQNSFLTRHTRKDIHNVTHHETDNPHSMLFTFLTIIAAKRSDIEISSLPDVLARYRTHVYADDRRDIKVLDARAASHTKMGLSENDGGVVVVRPDGYVGCILKLVEGSGTIDALEEYFSAFLPNNTADALPNGKI